MPKADDLKVIANNALANLGTIKNNALTKKELLAEMLANFTTDTEKQATQSQKTTRENASARGILQGSQSFDDASAIEDAKSLAIGRAGRQKGIDEAGIDRDVAGAETGYGNAYADWLAQKEIEDALAAQVPAPGTTPGVPGPGEPGYVPPGDTGPAVDTGLPPMGYNPPAPTAYAAPMNPAPPPTPIVAAPLAQHQSFMEWHASLSPEDQARFNAAYAAKAATQPITSTQQKSAQAALAKAAVPKAYTPYQTGKKYL